MSITAARVAHLVGPDFLDSSAMYAGLTASLRVIIGDGRIAPQTRLPSERALADVLGVSRTTVTRAYAALVEEGFATARQGSGTTTRLPVDLRVITDRALAPRPEDPDLIDLNCAAPAAPAGLMEAYQHAVERLPGYMSGHGYYPAGLPELQQAIAETYVERGLPTDPCQILVTAGALAAAAVVSQAVAPAEGVVVVENPVYPNATKALAHRGARMVAAPVDPGGWDMEALAHTVASARPALAYLIPDFQNPTGNVMSAAQREEHATILRRHGTTPVVDEAHQGLALDDQTMPPPYAAWSAEAVTIGSASKAFWGGLRLGWIRAPQDMVPALTNARLSLDLGAPVVEQLALVHLLSMRAQVLAGHRERLRRQRDTLIEEVRRLLPQWQFVPPTGGLALWCELPQPVATRLAATAERAGVSISPGPIFAVNGGLERYVRVPWTRPEDDLIRAVAGLSQAWASIDQGMVEAGTQRITVA